MSNWKAFLAIRDYKQLIKKNGKSSIKLYQIAQTQR